MVGIVGTDVSSAVKVFASVILEGKKTFLSCLMLVDCYGQDPCVNEHVGNATEKAKVKKKKTMKSLSKQKLKIAT